MESSETTSVPDNGSILLVNVARDKFVQQKKNLQKKVANVGQITADASTSAGKKSPGINTVRIDNEKLVMMYSNECIICCIRVCL